MNKYRKLFNNSLIFTIGNFGSKVISFLMVPLYTTLLTTEQFGTIDLVVTTISLLLPIVTLEIGQAVLRFTIEWDNTEIRKKIYNNSMILIIICSLILFIGTVVMIKIGTLDSYLYTALLISKMFNTFLSGFVRGIGEVKAFAISGILHTVFIVSFNILFLVKLNMNIDGYFISLILASIINNLYLLLKSNKYKMFSVEKLDLQLYNIFLKYSVPLMPNGIMWWIINGTTRYFILFFIGVSGNGIFAIANKIPSLINIMTTIFNQAWQLSSFEEYNSQGRNRFYTNIFEIYSLVLFLGGSVLLILLKPLMYILVDVDYYEGWIVIPALIFAVIYQSIASFLGTNYTAAQQTKGAFLTSVYAGIISVLANIILIPFLGLIGAGISTALSFVGMFILRYIDTQKYIKLNLNVKLFISNNLILLMQSVVLFITSGIIMYILELGLFILLLMRNRKLIGSVLVRLLSLFKK